MFKEENVQVVKPSKDKSSQNNSKMSKYFIYIFTLEQTCRRILD